MLESLTVKNLALIEYAEIDFKKGLNILSGETGAGKSIIIGSINIALGGIHEASSHFDLVAHEPDVYADNRKIMEKGKIIIPEPQVY